MKTNFKQSIPAKDFFSLEKFCKAIADVFQIPNSHIKSLRNGPYKWETSRNAHYFKHIKNHRRLIMVSLDIKKWKTKDLLQKWNWFFIYYMEGWLLEADQVSWGFIENIQDELNKRKTFKPKPLQLIFKKEA